MATKELSSSILLSERYASALYDLATENKCIDQIIKDLEKILHYYQQNKDFTLLLTNPLISNENKQKVLNNILTSNKAHNLIINFIGVISKNKRLSSLNNIIKNFFIINSEKRGDIVAEVTSAQDLNNVQKDKVEKQLYNKLGKKVSISYKVDKTIIGGLIIKFGSKMIDSSLITKLNNLNLAMKGAK